MKRCAGAGFVSCLSLISLLIFLAAATPELHAEENGPLGKYNFALKTGVFNTIDPALGHGIYFALEGYGEIKPNVYLGGEVGVGASLFIGTFNPLELNAKYAIEPVSSLVINFGAGISAIRVEDVILFSSREEVEWLFGGQFFTDISYKINWFYFGVDGKLQITQNFEDRDYGYSNFRIGLKAGFLF